MRGGVWIYPVQTHNFPRYFNRGFFYIKLFVNMLTNQLNPRIVYD
jgi:hypothetical protein